jgi:hypothetical protein
MLPPMTTLPNSLAAVLVCLAWTGAALAQTPPAQPIAPFSAGKPGAAFPAGWQPQKLSSVKRPTEYKLVDDGGTVVLMAHADGSASGMLHVASFDIKATPVIQWRWKVSGLIEGADNTVATKEDSPARIVIGFDGDRSKLGFRDKTASTLAAAASGRELPYAEIMYIWSNNKPVGTVIENPHTKRIQMIVAASGAGGVGKWTTITRNVYDDFKKAFGEEPGKVTEVALLTDTDNTSANVDAWYGDIRFSPPGN